MRYIDFLFYSYYCYFERRAKRFPKLLAGDSIMQALCLISLTIGLLLAICYLLVNEYITPMPRMPKLNSPEEKLIGIVIGGVIIGPLIYRYLYNKTIRKGDYKIFKEQWGDPRTHKKGRIAVLVYTIITLLLPFCLALILHEING